MAQRINSGSKNIKFLQVSRPFDRQTDRLRSSAMRPIINNWHAADFGQRFIL